MVDVLVIGGGLAGFTAAMAAKAKGAKVARARRGWGATALSTGVFDLAYSPALSLEAYSDRSVATHLMDIIAHRKRHPYGVLGLEKTFASLASGYNALRDALAGGPLALHDLDLESPNTVLPSSLGVAVPAGAYQPAHAGIDLAQPLEGTWGVVQLHGDVHFDAKRMVAGWSHDAERFSGTRPALQVIAVTYKAASAPVATARMLDDQRNVDELAESLRGKIDGLSGLIFPPVLGLTKSQTVRERLAEELGVTVIEAVAHMPSVPGIRLQTALDAHLQSMGVEDVGEVSAPVVQEDGRLIAMTTKDGLDIHAGGFVLATGRFVTGGVIWNHGCHEPIFGLPVVSEIGLMEEDSPIPVVREDPTESHPLMTTGIQTNPDLQPIKEARVAYPNLFAAGTVLGGFASRYALSADGVSLSTGFCAGQSAAEAAW